VVLSADDSSADDSALASESDSESAASTTQLVVTTSIFALVRGLRSYYHDVPCFWSRNLKAARSSTPKRRTAHWHRDWQSAHCGSYLNLKLLTGLHSGWQLEGTTGTRDSTVLDVYAGPEARTPIEPAGGP
jgi:hypothetical protein